jgi:hypothetical protein
VRIRNRVIALSSVAAALPAIALGLLPAAHAGVPARTAATSSNWPSYLYGPGHPSYNAAATALTPANAGALTHD